MFDVSGWFIMFVFYFSSSSNFYLFRSVVLFLFFSIYGIFKILEHFLCFINFKIYLIYLSLYIKTIQKVGCGVSEDREGLNVKYHT